MRIMLLVFVVLMASPAHAYRGWDYDYEPRIREYDSWQFEEDRRRRRELDALRDEQERQLRDLRMELERERNRRDIEMEELRLRRY